MKKIFSALVWKSVALLMTVGFAVFALPAQANQDCSDGCIVTTCDATGSCTVWQCSGSSGCIPIGSYFKNMIESQPGSPATSSVADDTEAKFVTVCPSEDRCDLYELAGSNATLLGEFDNMGAVIKARQMTNGAPEGAESKFITVCPSEDRCDLYELAGSEATVLGEFDNMGAVIRARQNQRSGGLPDAR